MPELDRETVLEAVLDGVTVVVEEEEVKKEGDCFGV